jgi:hypothetical protein
MKGKYEVTTRPEEIEGRTCEQCRTLVWAILIEDDWVLVERRVVSVMTRTGEFVEGFIPHADVCEPLTEES